MIGPDGEEYRPTKSKKLRRKRVKVDDSLESDANTIRLDDIEMEMNGQEEDEKMRKRAKRFLRE